MALDALDIRDFYASRLGHLAQRLIRRRIRHIWPEMRGQSLLGLGYATPFLAGYRAEASQIIGFFPRELGVLGWPNDEPRQVALVDNCHLPLQDFSVDRALLIHALEAPGDLAALMDEVWRVLAGGGKLLVVAANRNSAWARRDSTPFGHGTPYSAGQLKKLLRAAHFIPERTEHALFVPPSERRFMLSAALGLEEIGVRWCSALCGVTLIEASKQIYQAIPASQRRLRQRRMVVVPAASIHRDL